MTKLLSSAGPVQTTRLDFIKKAGLITAAFYIIPRHVLGRGFRAPSDKLQIAAIGAGGKGADNIQRAWNNGSENIVALCDVDQKQASAMFAKYPKAKRFTDFREMLEKAHKTIDAVIIATPDHTHAVATLQCMHAGKHVYTQKPLTHDIYEARMLTLAALKYPALVTQMGNQGSSGDDTRKVEAWIQAGLIGQVHKVQCWTNRPVWPQGLPAPVGNYPVPSTLDWDLWQGTAPSRPFNAAFLPFNWRGWWDYGTGALGDMACHIMDVPFRALKLGYPTDVQCSIGSVYADFFKEAWYPESCPPSSSLYFTFPARGELPGLGLSWLDGGMLPERPEELEPDELMGGYDGGVIYEGSKGKLMTDYWGLNARLLPTLKMKETSFPAVIRPLVTGGIDGHETQWVQACKRGDPASVSSPFAQAGPLTETVLMGNLAIRSYMYREVSSIKTEQGTGGQKISYPGRKKLLWNGKEMRITNFEPANLYVKRTYRAGWPGLSV